MIDHLSISVKDVPMSTFFYKKALAPLGLELMLNEHGWAGFGKNKKLSLFIKSEGFVEVPLHIAFLAKNRSEVDKFYSEALAAGGVDNGKPGLRPNYHAYYYAAYVTDPNGFNIEAVCHAG